MARIITQNNSSRRDFIMKKAATLFRQKGFASTSMRDLAEAVGVEAPSLYNHIGSKSEILQAICFNIANEFNGHLNKVLKSSDKPASKLEAIIRFHIQTMLALPDEVYVANHEWKQLTDPFLSNFLLQRKAYENALAALLEQGMEKKMFRKLNPLFSVLTILSALRGLEAWQRHKKTISKDDLENHLVTQLLQGIIK